MTNVNCLEGLHCPICKQEDRLQITGVALFEVTDGGTGEPEGGIEWGDESPTHCPSCEYGGTLKDFRKDDPDPSTESSYEVVMYVKKRYTKVYKAVTAPAAIRKAKLERLNAGVDIETAWIEDLEFYDTEVAGIETAWVEEDDS